MTGNNFSRQGITEGKIKAIKLDNNLNKHSNMSKKHPTAWLKKIQHLNPRGGWRGGLYLVLAEGGLDEAGGLVQLSLLRVGQSQLGQVSLHLAVGGIDELTPVGRGWERRPLQGPLPQRGAPGTEAGVGRRSQGFVIQRSAGSRKGHVRMMICGGIFRLQTFLP